jgi:MoaA/NifB/PqqE/SkfB family radical SAM enzyme
MAELRKILFGAPHVFSLFKKIISGQKFGFSFDLADRCPIGCNCYWKEMKRVRELEDEEVMDFFERRRKEGMLLATIVGGEPYVRPELLKKVVNIMPANWVVTSGTSPLMILPKTTHFISIDGKDAKTHNEIRKAPGLFERILKNLVRVRSVGKFPVFIHTVLNALNFEQIQEMILFWRKNRLADGIEFSLVTPVSEKDKNLTLERREKIWIVGELLRMRKRFGNFICMSSCAINRYHPEVLEKQTPESCKTARFVASYQADGSLRKQCIFSDKGDCKNCGCVITAFMDALIKIPPDLNNILNLARLYTP